MVSRDLRVNVLVRTVDYCKCNGGGLHDRLYITPRRAMEDQPITSM